MKAAATAFLICLLPIAAAAADDTTATPAHSSGFTMAEAQNSGPMTVQQLHSTFLIAPDVKVTRLDGTTGVLAGLYGGALLDEQWLIGAGAYWLTNGGNGRSMAYGGGVVGWMTNGERPIGFSVRSLIGWGESHLPGTITEPVFVYPYGPYDFFGPEHQPHPIGPPTFPTQTHEVRYHEGFFVAEPQADVIFRVASWARIDAGGGYRIIGAANGFEHRLRGATASISLQVGSF